MAVDAHSLRILIEDELTTLSDARVVAHVMEMLVEPRAVLRSWDYGARGQQYPCWIVLDDPPRSFSVITFCEFGFGPKCPWGLISSGDMHMGMDSGWFPSFLDAYFESWAATELPIWQIMKEEPDQTLVLVNGEGTWASTWDRINELRSADPIGRYHCRHAITYGASRNLPQSA